MRVLPHMLSERLIVGTILAAVIAAATAGADDSLSSYFDGLRDRRMFSVGEREALRRLSEDGLSSQMRVILLVELSRTYAAHAAFSVGDERDELWAQAESIVDPTMQADVPAAFEVVVATQWAMVPTQRGAQRRWEGELFPLDDAARQETVAVLKESLTRLRPLPDRFDNQIRGALTRSRGSNGDDPEPPPWHLHQLRRRVEFAMAAASLDLAKILPSGADRTAALLEADAKFDEFTKSARPDELAWQARVHRLEILRLRSQGDRLEGAVRSLIDLEPPQGVIDAAKSVLVQWWLEEQRPDNALAALEEHRAQFGLADEHLQALVVESLLASRRIARQKGDAALAEELLTRARSVHERLPEPWRSRTRMLLELLAEEDRYGAELAESVRLAKSAWQNGDVDQAVLKFTESAARAHRQGQADLAVEFSLSAASAQIATSRFEDAAQTLATVIEAYPDHRQAPEADLLRAFAIGRVFEQMPTDETEAAYRDALIAHRQTYTSEPTAAEATWMLARLAEHDRDWNTALELLGQIPQNSPHYPQSMARTAAIFEYVIGHERRQDQPTTEWEQRAVKVLTATTNQFPREDALTLEQAQTVKSLSRILLNRESPDFSLADHWLDRILQTGQQLSADALAADASWKSLLAAASQLRIISLAGQGRLKEARQLLEDSASDQPERLLDVLEGLSAIAGEMGIESRAGIAQMQLEVSQRLQTKAAEFDAQQKRQLDVAQAEAHAALGQWPAAARIYTQQLWEQPQQPDLIAALAKLYEDCGSPSCLRQAIEQWQTLAGLQRKGSEDWLRSRYRVAWCHHRLGEDEAARKLIGVARVLYPDLGSPSLKARYEALAAEIEQ